MSTTTTAVKSMDAVCEALRDVHDEATLWHLSDELVLVAPSGVGPVDAVVKEAKRRGIPTKSTNTLRLYRDVAIRFPKAERVPMVSFSAHREAIVIGDVKQARKVLEDLSAAHGPAGVTVTTVKQAIGAMTGKVPTPKATPAAAKAAVQQHAYTDLVADLMKGGKGFIAALNQIVTMPGVTLDGLHVGLTAVITDIEARRSKAARKASAAKAAPKGAVKPVVAPSGKPKVIAGNGKAGDLRDL